MSTEDEIFEALNNTRGPQLMRELARQFSELNSKVALLEKKVALLGVYNDEHSALLEAAEESVFAREPELATSFEVLASDFLRPEDGFHALEYGKNGHEFRWAAPEGVMIFRPVVDRAQPLKLTLTMMATIEKRNFQDLTIYDNDQQLTWTSASNDVLTEFVAELPERETKGATLITVRVPYFQQLSEKDFRVAGVSFNKLEIGAADIVKS